MHYNLIGFRANQRHVEVFSGIFSSIKHRNLYKERSIIILGISQATTFTEFRAVPLETEFPSHVPVSSPFESPSLGLFVFHDPKP